MKAMFISAIKILVGFVIVFYCMPIVGNFWAATVIFFIIGAVVQTLYARSLNEFLGGQDPVWKFGARNLSQLRAVMPIPVAVFILDFLAKAFMYASVISILGALGFVGIHSFNSETGEDIRLF
ncbi:MAG: hypothetical protein ACR2P7_02215 [bacterium]